MYSKCYEFSWRWSFARPSTICLIAYRPDHGFDKFVHILLNQNRNLQLLPTGSMIHSTLQQNCSAKLHFGIERCSLEPMNSFAIRQQAKTFQQVGLANVCRKTSPSNGTRVATCQRRDTTCTTSTAMETRRGVAHYHLLRRVAQFWQCRENAKMKEAKRPRDYNINQHLAGPQKLNGGHRTELNFEQTLARLHPLLLLKLHC